MGSSEPGANELDPPMSDNQRADVTALLQRWHQGDRTALDALMPLVYEELRRAARAQLRHERAGHTLQTTALVHEVFLRLVGIDRLSFQNRAHFFAVASRLMRQILVDQARRQRAGKRGGGVAMRPLDEAVSGAEPNLVDVLTLDAALGDLAQVDERLSRVVELKFFAGLTIDETAAALETSPATVERDWSMAKAWLLDRLSAREGSRVRTSNRGAS